tara:strand:- start:1302 stop:3680 length:2379 start_codon:yes stop_codon:yes gene_type:complete
MKQTDLDREMISLGQERYWKTILRAQQQELETYGTASKYLLSQSIDRLEKELHKWIKNAQTSAGRKHRVLPYFELLSTELVCALACRTVLDGISQRRSLTNIAIKIGQHLEDEHRFGKVKENYPEHWNDIEGRMKSTKGYQAKIKFLTRTAKHRGIPIPRWNKGDATAIGLVLVELMRISTGLIEIKTITNVFNKSHTIVEPTQDLLDWLKKSHAQHEILTPVYMPTVVSPKPWTSIYDGGYPNEIVRRRPLVKTYNTNVLEELNNCEMPEVYSSVNTMQNTRFGINDDVYQVMKYFWETNNDHGVLPRSNDIEMPVFPEGDNEAIKLWKRQARDIHIINQADRSKRLQLAKVLFLADKFVDETLHFPLQLDWRGRSYCLPNYLHYQGADFSKGLLRFREGKEIQNEDHVHWLGIHTANCWGLDKNPFKDRLDWVFSNRQLFKSIYNDPLGNNEWTKAAEPWQFLASALELAEFFENGYGTRTRVPVAQDASNQGLQLYSILLRDQQGCLATNVLPSDRPKDLYQLVADKCIERLKTSDDPMAKIWLKFGVDRKVAKRPTMCVPYSLSRHSCKEYVTDWFFEEVKIGDRDNLFYPQFYKPCNFLSNFVWDAIDDVVTGAKVGMQWLQDVTKVCLKNGITPRWITPDGFIVNQKYSKQASKEIKTSIGDTIRRHRINYSTGQISNRKNVNGICPNYIHSLDKALLFRTVNIASANGVNEFAMVHDSYATNAVDSGILATTLRQATVDIFSDCQLSIFKSQIESQLPVGVELPDVPKLGDFDIRCVMDSDYYFA